MVNPQPVPRASQPEAGARRSAVVYRLPLGPRLASLFVVMLLAIVSVGMTVFAIWCVIEANWGVSLAVIASACVLAALTAYVARDWRGKWGLRVAMDADAVALDLPAGRSLIHRPPAQRLTISYADIEAIETRLEAFRSQKMTTMQRAYALRRKTGDEMARLVFLFEDRAIGTPLESAYFTGIAAALAARIGVPVRDLGMVKGDGGLLSAWGTSAPDWAAPPLSAAQQELIWKDVAATGALPMMVFTLFAILWQFRH
jgi:hypothetical protein